MDIYKVTEIHCKVCRKVFKNENNVPAYVLLAAHYLQEEDNKHKPYRSISCDIINNYKGEKNNE